MVVDEGSGPELGPDPRHFLYLLWQQLSVQPLLQQLTPHLPLQQAEQ
jgi:hypothetical protein